MSKLDNKGFSFIELLGVVVIMGVLLLLAIPSISRLIVDSRKQAYIDSVIIQKNTVEAAITADRYYVYDQNTVYYFDYKMFSDADDRGKSPFGDWIDCYVVVTYDGENNHFYWTGLDSNGWKIDLRKQVSKLKTKDVYHTNSTSFIPGNTVGARDNIVIYKEGQDEPAEQTPSNDVSYADAVRCFDLDQLSDGTYSIVGYNTTCGTDVGVPSSVDGKPVTVIGENAFKGKGLTSVVLYYGIKEIMNGAFQNNSIKDVKLSATVKKIGPWAFYNNKIKNLDLPDGIERIETYGFAYNEINSISFPKTLTYLGSYAFYHNNLSEIDLKSNPSIGGAAFSSNSMPDASAIIYKFNASKGETDYTTIVGYAGQSKNVVIPPSVNGVAPLYINSSAFASCALKSVSIPDSVTHIYDAAFYNNSLTSIKLPKNLVYIGGQAFRGNYLTSVTIPTGVSTIGAAAFTTNCFPSGSDIIYKHRSDGTFDYSTIVSGASGRCGVSTLNIPAVKNGVKLRSIVGGAFQCGYYTTINLPDLSQTDHLTIGTNAFYQNNLPKDKGFFYRINNGTYNYSILDSYGGNRSGEIVIPEESHGTKLTTISASFQWTGFSKITIPKTVTSIAGYCFCRSNSNNTGLRTIVNKTGRTFNWYSLTCSNHSNPDGNFATGTVSHQSGDVQIVAN